MNKKIRFDEMVLKELKTRRNALMSAQILFKMASSEADIYLNQQLINVGLDLKQKYDINLETGEIKLVKLEEIEQEEEQ